MNHHHQQQQQQRSSGRRRRRNLVKGQSGSGSSSLSSSSSSSSLSNVHTSRVLQKDSTTSTSTSNSNNIFDHSTSVDTVPVNCGTEEMPFLTTFVTSIQFRDGNGNGGGGSGGSKSKKGSSSSKSSKSNKSSSSSSGKGKGGKGTSGDDKDAATYGTYSSTKSTSSTTTPKTTTIATSPAPPRKGSGKGGKGGSSKKRSSKDTGSYSSNSEDEYYEDGDNDPDGSNNRAMLTSEEQRAMQTLFRNVINGYTFTYCDGFFRTVYTVSMTMMEREQQEQQGYKETVAVTPERTYRTAPNNDTNVNDIDIDPMDIDDDNSTIFSANARQSGSGSFWGSPTNYDEENDDTLGSAPAPGPTSASSTSTSSSSSSSSSSRSQGGWMTNAMSLAASESNTAIYFVSLTATCRNCEVTQDLNFPLLMIPEEDGGVDEPTMELSFSEDKLLVAPTDESDADSCTCPAVSVEVERRRRYRRQRQLQEREEEEDDENLYRPPPNAPTAEELMGFMNAAIEQDELLQNRIRGLVRLVEPDYFNGENPELTNTMAPTIVTSQAPTVSPLTRRPTQPPTDSTLPVEESSVTGRVPTTAATLLMSLISSSALMMISFLFL